MDIELDNLHERYYLNGNLNYFVGDHHFRCMYVDHFVNTGFDLNDADCNLGYYLDEGSCYNHFADNCFCSL